MRYIVIPLFALAASLCVTAATFPMTKIPAALENTERYDANARLTVSMPQLDEDVVYRLTLHSRPVTIGDTLSPCDYLIDWLIENHDGAAGFSAYYNGNHYRYSGERLQEYHAADDPTPFISEGKRKSVQETAQFINLLPRFMSEELNDILRNPDYTVALHPDTLIDGRRLTVLDATLTIGGSVAKEVEYAFAPDTFLPVRIRMENNPGSISEQSIAIDYCIPDESQSDITALNVITEENLMNRYPDIFEKFRQSNFRIENLPGNRLPGFALPTTTGERYSRRTADGFHAPTLIAILDAETAFTPQLIASLRSAIDRLPYEADIILAFTGNHTDTIEQAAGRIRMGEHMLMGAGPLARNCGVTVPPAVIIADKDGMVTDVLIGYNKDMDSDVIQKMALLKP